MTPDPITRARQRLVADLVQAIAHEVHRETRHFLDEERLERIVNAWLPLTYAEADAAMAELDRERPAKAPAKPSLPARLRAALGYDRSISLVGLLEGAIERIEAHKHCPTQGA